MKAFPTNFCSANASKRKTMVAVPSWNFKPSIATNLCACNKAVGQTATCGAKTKAGLEPEPGAVCFAGLDLQAFPTCRRYRYCGQRRTPVSFCAFIISCRHALIERRLELDESDLYGRLHEFDNVHVTPGPSRTTISFQKWDCYCGARGFRLLLIDFERKDKHMKQQRIVIMFQLHERTGRPTGQSRRMKLRSVPHYQHDLGNDQLIINPSC